MIAANDLLKEVEAGLRKAWLASFAMNDSPYISMRPEYLTTVVLGIHLSEWLANKCPTEKYVVRLEEQTKDVAKQAFPALPLPYRSKNVHGRAKKESGEEGLVDAVIYRNSAMFPETVAVIEVKNFDQPNDLLEKDLIRNQEFMELTDPVKPNQIQFALLTFFLHDKKSRVAEDAENFIRAKVTAFSSLADKYSTPSIRASVTIKTLANYPSLTAETALLPVEDGGPPAIDLEENHHIVFGAVLMERIQPCIQADYETGSSLK